MVQKYLQILGLLTLSVPVLTLVAVSIDMIFPRIHIVQVDNIALLALFLCAVVGVALVKIGLTALDVKLVDRKEEESRVLIDKMDDHNDWDVNNQS